MQLTLLVFSLSVVTLLPTRRQELPTPQSPQTLYKVLRSHRQDRPGIPSLQGYSVSVDRYLDRPQIERLICQVILNEKPGPSSILGVAVYYRLSELPIAVFPADQARQLDHRIAEYLWNTSLPGARKRLIIDKDWNGNRVGRGYEFDHTAGCSPRQRIVQ